MKVEVIHYPNGYGFGHDWQLKLTNDQKEIKQFFLGQDAKVCRRLIGCIEDDVQSLIGGNNLDDPETNKNLAWLIIESLSAYPGHDRELIAQAIFNDCQPWEIAVE